MRLWSFHPQYLDVRGLVALWREALLAQKVLRGKTRGYRQHPQLERFKSQPAPLGAIAVYLRAVAAEATRRGYKFDVRKIMGAGTLRRIPVTSGQLRFEWSHLKRKLRRRDPEWHKRLTKIQNPRPHPLFRKIPGGRASWEKITA